jgi:hypothetical protein
MNREDIGLPPHLQRLVNANVSGLDIMHGELKNLMLEAENMMLTRTNPDHKKYWSGKLDGFTELYNLTYDLSFAIGEKVEA